jgi:hypothetical protein
MLAKAKSAGDLRSLCNATAISEASTMQDRRTAGPQDRETDPPRDPISRSSQ